MPDQLERLKHPEDDTRSLLSQLIAQSRLYEHTQDFRDLLEFVAQLPNIAPFNAMLLHVQKPGLRFAASAADWQARVGRTIREGARPLIVLVPFGPVGFVYDIEDTEGSPLPAPVAHAFRAEGPLDGDALVRMRSHLAREGITVSEITAGDGHAGHVQRIEVPAAKDGKKADKPKPPTYTYKIRLNAKHDPRVQFATLVHELGHVCLGHLGADRERRISDRQSASRAKVEIEAEAVSYLVCNRMGVRTNSESYLHAYVTHETRMDDVDVYAIMKAAGQVEVLLGIACREAYELRPAWPQANHSSTTKQ